MKFYPFFQGYKLRQVTVSISVIFPVWELQNLQGKLIAKKQIDIIINKTSNNLYLYTYTSDAYKDKALMKIVILVCCPRACNS